MVFEPHSHVILVIFVPSVVAQAPNVLTSTLDAPIRQVWVVAASLHCAPSVLQQKHLEVGLRPFAGKLPARTHSAVL
jgi:hypothetical protein